jgi:rhodanese-related sulfurtransferase
MLAACGEPAPTSSQPTTPTALVSRSDASVEDLAAALAQGAPLLDVRTPEEYATGHVPGAVSAPLDTIDPHMPAMAAYAKDEPLYVICASGGRSSAVADQLASAGFRTVNVLGGTNAWREQGRELEMPVSSR